MTYAARSAAHSRRARDKFELRAAPLVAKAAADARSIGEQRGRRVAEEKLTAVFAVAPEGRTYINEPERPVLRVAYPPTRLDRAFSDGLGLSSMTRNIETFRYVPWKIVLNGAEICWFNLEADSDEGRRRSTREAHIVFSLLDRAPMLLNQARYSDAAYTELRQLFVDCQTHAVRWLGDPGLAMTMRSVGGSR